MLNAHYTFTDVNTKPMYFSVLPIWTVIIWIDNSCLKRPLSQRQRPTPLPLVREVNDHRGLAAGSRRPPHAQDAAPRLINTAGTISRSV
ncbi:unnamed protein product [Danaus chrysippus]|uniref:(African queen) hypothetical protein n=1 Tax=Danaus chrysippus TaxID=151541 RepID=A0A8J2QWK4_9NEOP|nr:unnamed protein product [Danaus chrysippus]